MKKRKKSIPNFGEKKVKIKQNKPKRQKISVRDYV